MRTTVLYHSEGDTWWAETPDFLGFSGADDTLDGCRLRVREALRELGHDDLMEFVEAPPSITGAPTYSWLDRP